MRPNLSPNPPRIHLTKLKEICQKCSIVEANRKSSCLFNKAIKYHLYLHRQFQTECRHLLDILRSRWWLLKIYIRALKIVPESGNSPWLFNDLASSGVYLRITSALSGWKSRIETRIMSPELIHTFFLMLPRMWAILFTPSKHWTSTLPLPNIFATCAYSKIKLIFQTLAEFFEDQLPLKRITIIFPFSSIFPTFSFILGHSLTPVKTWRSLHLKRN